MTENNAAQLRLTDGEIDAVDYARLAPREYARTIEQAVLSKLRAEGVPVAGMPEYITDNRYHIQYRLGWNNCLSDCRAAMQGAAPVASAPADERAAFEEDYRRRTISNPRYFGRDANGRYVSGITQAAWEHWQSSQQRRAAFDHPVFAFLLGEGQLHGVDFGERAPGAAGKWWWRKDLRAALASAPVAKPKRAPLDDWRVQAIADCLETEWDEMSPDLAEAYARTIVGYLIEYEKESDRIEAQNAAEPVHPVVQAVHNLRASAPVAGEAQDWPTTAQEAEAEKQWDAWAHEMNQCRDASLEQAARICDAEGQEWDSDAVITEKNYAEHCARRIRALKGSAAPQASTVAEGADQPDIGTLRRIGAAHDARNAAPQASEAVRNADVSALLSFIFGRFGQPGDAGELPDTVAAAVRRLERVVQPQADKDGGQQRAGVVTDDMRYAVRFAPSSAHWSERLMEFFGPDAREGIDALEKQLREARAALSATQTEQGERD